ncbi:MAG: winged helix-turn-helix transcriptional regulator, partial [Spirochaetota bacterium]|nr:winged helix-turn-helix transcriptional regulator [Spirochaetota bacterium]
MNKTTDRENTTLNSNEELVLSKISLEGVNSQREISSRSGLSVGMINILIKNLVQKGYVKLTRLNKKNIRYLLTTKGLTEQINLTRLYIQDTFDRLANYKKCVTDLVQAKINDNNKQFIIIGENELAN